MPLPTSPITDATFTIDPIFRVEVPTDVPGVPTEILQPRNTWPDKAAYDAQAAKLAYMFAENFKYYADGVAPEVAAAGPIVSGDVDTSELRFSKPGEG